VPRYRSHIKEKMIDKMFRPTSPETQPSRANFRSNDSLLFCLCMSCATECEADGECASETVDERALTGTCFIEEVSIAEQKFYEVIEIFEVYE